MTKTLMSQNYAQKAERCVEEGNYVEAIAHFDRALIFDPENINLWIQRGCACTHLHHYQKALWSFEEALNLNPQDSTIQLFRGVCLHHLQQYNQAYQSYNQALGQKAHNPFTWVRQKIALLCETGKTLVLTQF
ncbi:tetratricopeptide repeat protein [Roseofilum sp. BLCC_M154]|uniref:Tetratricopeptide repeat protein n=1 Tax=Roseofilum acuticapitatum BLCC-M154 TaxID=3022444 RepID=A0ABT7ALS5_9CYAN|nr:tetratricopeptide repeat protein [Roseofilum acuticapitatum]MDJ1167846.1 tetratricopeptide repeat protein [Roseofilum acuticapitatum BLCC-M154]